MTDKTRPNDPYDLIQGNWPDESEAAYHALEQQMTTLQNTTLEHSEDATSDSASVGEDFLGRTGAGISESLGELGKGLDGSSEAARTCAMQYLSAAETISGTKAAIRLIVKAANPQIDEAKDQEAAGEEPEPSSDTLINNARSDVQAARDDYQTDMSAVTAALTASTTPDAPAPPAPRAWRAPNRETAYTHAASPERREEIFQSGQYPEAFQYQSGVPPTHQPGHPGQPVPRHPGTPAPAPSAPAPGSPGSPNVSSPSAGNSTGLGGNPTLGNPNLSTSPGVPGGTPDAGSPTAGAPGGPAAGQPGQPGSSGLLGTPTLGPLGVVGLSGLPSAAAAGAAGAASAATSPAPSAPTSSTPGYPAPTGSTPGAAATGPTGIAPIAPGSPGAVTPAAPAPGTPSTGTPAAPATGTTPTPGGQGTPAPGSPAPQQPSREVTGAAAIQHFREAGEKRAAALVPPIVTAPVEEQSFIRTLPETEAAAHSVLAGLRASFEEAGWDQPLAVAGIEREDVSATVFATTDGLSLWPTGVALPDSVYPLHYLLGHEDTTLFGFARPEAKLAALREARFILTTEPIETGGENTLPVQQQTPSQFREIISAGDHPAAHVARGADLDVEDVDALLAQVMKAHPEVPDREAAAEALRAARWVDEQPGNYVDLFVSHLIAEGNAAHQHGDLGGAVYLASQVVELLGIPDPESGEDEMP